MVTKHLLNGMILQVVGNDGMDAFHSYDGDSFPHSLLTTSQFFGGRSSDKIHISSTCKLLKSNGAALDPEKTV